MAVHNNNGKQYLEQHHGVIYGSNLYVVKLPSTYTDHSFMPVATSTAWSLVFLLLSSARVLNHQNGLPSCNGTAGCCGAALAEKKFPPCSVYGLV